MSLQVTKPSSGKKLTKAQQRKRALALHKYLRLGIQLVFFVLAPGVFSSAMSGVRGIFSQIGSTQAVELGSFFAVLVAALVYTVLFGRFFCGYACAFGTMGDVLYLLGTPLRKILHLEGKPIRGRLATALSYGKFVVLTAVCALCFFNMWDKVSTHDPWTVFGLVVGGTFTGLDAIGLALLLAVMVLQMLFERSFCRFFCPMGAVFALVPVLPCSQFGRRQERCGKRCDRCIAACPAGIHPDKGSNLMGECFQCGRCAETCPLANIHLIDIELPEQQVLSESADKKEKSPNSKISFKGSGAAFTLIRAAVLLAMLWLLGATRFLPDAASLLPFGFPWS